jgi:hypothetical protein
MRALYVYVCVSVCGVCGPEHFLNETILERRRRFDASVFGPEGRSFDRIFERRSRTMYVSSNGSTVERTSNVIVRRPVS